MRINSRIDLKRAVRREAMNESITVYNYGSGMRLGGRWADGAAVTAALTASVQVASGQTLQLLPPGTRISEAIEVFSLTDGGDLLPLQRSDGKRPSEVEWRGDRYTVEVFEDFSELANYWWALCSSVEQ